ncbi:MAG TPA: site-2 protease family protein [Gemmatirosa sp.]|nr:site-2 protease family protein [Gemmatirosa sp.]
MNFQSLLIAAPALLLAMVAHEYAHGYAALRQGDPTAYQLGRLTWNPVKHIDPVMTVLVPVMLAMAGGPIFGGAKPIPVDPRNYRRLKRGDIIVSLAGVTANVVLAVLLAALVVPLGVAGRELAGAARTFGILQEMALWGVQINLFLALFNLLPLPPLDGSHVFKYLLPPALSLQYQALGRFGFALLFLLLLFGRPLLTWWMTPAYAGIRALLQLVRPYVLVGVGGA